MFQKISKAWNSLFQALELFVSSLRTLCSGPWNSLCQALELFVPRIESCYEGASQIPDEGSVGIVVNDFAVVGEGEAGGVVSHLGKQLEDMFLLLGRKGKFAMMVSVEAGVGTKIALYLQAQGVDVASLHFVKEPVEAPCLADDSQLVEVGAAPVTTEALGIDAEAYLGPCRHHLPYTIAYALLAARTLGVETRDKAGGNIAEVNMEAVDCCHDKVRVKR